MLREDEVRHWLSMRPGVVYSYVVEGPGGAVTDFLSFYTLPSTVIGHDQYDTLNVRASSGGPPSLLPISIIMIL